MLKNDSRVAKIICRMTSRKTTKRFALKMTKHFCQLPKIFCQLLAEENKISDLWEQPCWSFSDVVLVSLLLTLNRLYPLFHCSYCWFWTSKCRLDSCYLVATVINSMIFLLILRWENSRNENTKMQCFHK